MRIAITVTLVAALLVQAVRLAVGFQLTDGIPVDPILRHDVLGILGFASAGVISGTVGLLMLFARRDSLVHYSGWIMAVVAGFQMSASHLAIMSGRSMQAVLQTEYLAAHLPSVAPRRLVRRFDRLRHRALGPALPVCRPSRVRHGFAGARGSARSGPGARGPTPSARV